MTAGPDVGEAVDVDRLASYLRGTLPTPPDSVEVTGLATSGSSNITAFVEVDGRSWVLRRPPLGELRPTAHDMLREYRFLVALQDSPVPVPRTVLACDDPSVLGAPFYLAERVDGLPVQAGIPDGFEDPAEIDGLLRAVMSTLADLHAVDWRDKELPGRPGQYLERQVRRWCDQFERTPTISRLRGLADVTRWVVEHRPEDSGSSVVHGDYGLHNMLIAPPPGAHVSAVLDWELATLGDPLADVAWFVSGWHRSQLGGGVTNPGNDLATWPGAPLPEQLLEWYAARSGREIVHWGFYEVFTLWKETIMVEGLYSQYVAGTAANPAVARLETEVPDQVERLLGLVGAQR